jgi:RimJ/RimL family protein N-acetyltransferase
VPADPGFAQLRTERLILRRFEPHDVTRFAEYRSDRDVARYQSWDSYTIERAERFLQDMRSAHPGVIGEWFQFAVADPSNDELLGDVALRLDNNDAQRAEIGFTFAAGHQGKGYATEAVLGVIDFAFGPLGVAIVYAVTDARNDRSIALLERIGMQRVSTDRALFKGAWCDEHTYELRRDDP